MNTNMFRLEKILDVEDLPYIESDLNFNQLVNIKKKQLKMSNE